jgi:hypothetical protein
MNRTPIDLLELHGNKSNLNRALKRAEKDAAKTISPENKKRLAKLDQLIDEQMSECECGGTVGEKEKRNPAFQNVLALIQARKMLLKEESAPEVEKSVDDILAEVDQIGRRN